MKKIISILITSFLAISMYAGEKTIKAVMLQPTGFLCEYQEKEDLMKISKSNIGVSDLEVITVQDENGKYVPETLVNKTRYYGKNNDITKDDYYHVKYNGKDYWAVTKRVSFYSNKAIISKDTAVYRSADITTLKEGTALTVGTIITIGQTYIANDKFNLVKINYFSSSDLEVYTGYVKVDKISTSKDDFKAMLIIDSIKNSTDEDARNENYNNFKKLKVSPAISQLCEKTMNDFNKAKEEKENAANNSAKDELKEISYEQVSYNGSIYVEYNDKINAREMPTTTSSVVNKFASEAQDADEDPTVYNVNITMKSSSKDTIDGISDYWYFVTDTEKPSLNGWVFGAYIYIQE